jgi:hypothetical protein
MSENSEEQPQSEELFTTEDLLADGQAENSEEQRMDSEENSEMNTDENFETEEMMNDDGEELNEETEGQFFICISPTMISLLAHSFCRPRS